MIFYAEYTYYAHASYLIRKKRTILTFDDCCLVMCDWLSQSLKHKINTKDEVLTFFGLVLIHKITFNEIHSFWSIEIGHATFKGAYPFFNSIWIGIGGCGWVRLENCNRLLLMVVWKTEVNDEMWLEPRQLISGPVKLNAGSIIITVSTFFCSPRRWYLRLTPNYHNTPPRPALNTK